MNKKESFIPGNWLGKTSPKDQAETPIGESPLSVPEFKKPFNFQNFVVPEWKGDSLISKEALKLKKEIKTLLDEALKIINTFPARNKSLKKNVFKEFLKFSSAEKLNISLINEYDLFWDHFNVESSPFNEQIERFKKLYALRTINIYLLKVKFVSSLYDLKKQKISLSELLNPDHTLSMIFRRSSSTELDCDSLKSNEYSWFRPSNNLEQNILNIKSLIIKLGNNDFLNVLNYELLKELGLLSKESDVNNYSHSISHKSFGKFINDLLITVPEWLENHQGYYNFSDEPKCLKTLFTGDYLKSFALSHWLAQEHNCNLKWYEIICPEFQGRDQERNNYLKYCQELLFINFLLHFSECQNHEPIALICSLYKQINNKQSEDALGQISIFNIKMEQEPKLYDRIVLSLCQTPKKNPHHLLVTKILKEGESLSNNGYLYVFSNQKLFVPSHSERVEGLLKKMNISAHFSFENLNGRGEIPKYLYVFNKKMISSNWNKNIQNVDLVKESCLTFNFHGDLCRFSKFELQRETFARFISDQDSINTPLYQEEPSDDLSFEFHQDAIIGGKLLSHNSDTNNITHPNYFRKLTKSCVTFDQFFMIEHLGKNNHRDASNLLGIETNERQRYPLLLVIDYSDEENIKLEMTSFDLYRAKADKHGHAYFLYFGLTPKSGDLNVNLFRDFFDTGVGKQIIQLTFNGSLKKAKSKLSAMLVPKFLLNTKFLPSTTALRYRFFNKSLEEIKSASYESLESELNDIFQHMGQDQTEYPWHISCMISHFKLICMNYLHDLEDNSSLGALDYQAKNIVQELMALDKRPIYNDNKDIYIEPFLSHKDEFELTLSSTKLYKNEQDENILALYHREKLLMNLRAEYELLHFINFILSHSIGGKLSSVIHGLRVPSYVDMKAIVNQYIEGQKQIKNIVNLCHQKVNQIIVEQIFNS